MGNLEQIRRIEGLSNATELIESTFKEIYNDLIEDGFETDEIIHYIEAKANKTLLNMHLKEIEVEAIIV